MSSNRAPINVTIVRPYKTGPERIGTLLGYIAVYFINALPLMLILGAITDWGFGYWHTLLALVAIQMVQVRSNYAFWTKEGKK